MSVGSDMVKQLTMSAVKTFSECSIFGDRFVGHSSYRTNQAGVFNVYVSFDDNYNLISEWQNSRMIPIDAKEVAEEITIHINNLE